MPNRKASKRLRGLLNQGKATEEQLFNELAGFMVNKISKHSVTRGELMKYFDCSSNRATRILNTFVLSGKLTKDPDAYNLYWLVVE